MDVEPPLHVGQVVVQLHVIQRIRCGRLRSLLLIALVSNELWRLFIAVLHKPRSSHTLIKADPRHGLHIHIPEEVTAPVLCDDLHRPELGFILRSSQRVVAAPTDA